MAWNLKRRKRLLYALIGVVVFLLLLVLTTTGTRQRLFMAATLIALAAYLVIWAVLWRCPHCGRMLGRMDDARCCKYCGKKLYREDI